MCKLWINLPALASVPPFCLEVPVVPNLHSATGLTVYQGNTKAMTIYQGNTPKIQWVAWSCLHVGVRWMGYAPSVLESTKKGKIIHGVALFPNADWLILTIHNYFTAIHNYDCKLRGGSQLPRLEYLCSQLVSNVVHGTYYDNNPIVTQIWELLQSLKKYQTSRNTNITDVHHIVEPTIFGWRHCVRVVLLHQVRK